MGKFTDHTQKTLALTLGGPNGAAVASAVRELVKAAVAEHPWHTELEVARATIKRLRETLEETARETIQRMETETDRIPSDANRQCVGCDATIAPDDPAERSGMRGRWRHIHCPPPPSTGFICHVCIEPFRHGDSRTDGMHAECLEIAAVTGSSNLTSQATGDLARLMRRRIHR